MLQTAANASRFSDMDKEDQIYELGQRLITGDLTDIQYKFWLSQLDVSSEEALAIFRKKEIELTIQTAVVCSKLLVLVWFTSAIVVRLCTGEWHFPGFN